MTDYDHATARIGDLVQFTDEERARIRRLDVVAEKALVEASGQANADRTIEFINARRIDHLGSAVVRLL